MTPSTYDSKFRDKGFMRLKWTVIRMCFDSEVTLCRKRSSRDPGMVDDKRILNFQVSASSPLEVLIIYIRIDIVRTQHALPIEANPPCDLVRRLQDLAIINSLLSSWLPSATKTVRYSHVVNSIGRCGRERCQHLSVSGTRN